MKEKVTGIISFIGAIGWGLFGLFIITNEKVDDAVGFFAIISLLTATISTILYVIWTKFGKKGNSALDEIDLQNQILKKQIEQKELLKKLEL